MLEIAGLHWSYRWFLLLVLEGFPGLKCSDSSACGMLRVVQLHVHWIVERAAYPLRALRGRKRISWRFAFQGKGDGFCIPTNPVFALLAPS